MRKYFLFFIIAAMWSTNVVAQDSFGHIIASETAVRMGSTLQFTAEGIDNPVWSSSDEVIATVDQTGLVTGVSTGVAYIYCSSGNIPVDSIEIYVYSCSTLTISNVEELCAFRDAVNAGHGVGVYKGEVNENGFSLKEFLITNDLDLSSVCDTALGSWIPIGTGSAPFKGFFNGGNHLLSNLYINGLGYRSGFFGYVNGAIIQNVHIVSGQVTGSSSVAALVANADVSNIAFCTNAASVFASDTCAGIVGLLVNGSSLRNCLNMGNVTGTGDNCIGGVVGVVRNEGCTILNCVNSGVVVGGNCVGGIVGMMNNSSGTPSIMRYCLNYGEVAGLHSTESDRFGGIYGYVSMLSRVYDCFVDKQLCTMSPEGIGYNLGNPVLSYLTDEITGDNPTLLSGFSSDNWVFSEDMYPRPRGIENIITTIVASTPLYLVHSEIMYDDINNTFDNFTLGTACDVVWTSSNEDLISVDGALAAIICLENRETVTMTVAKNNIEKSINIVIQQPVLVARNGAITIGNSTYVDLKGNCFGTWRCTDTTVVRPLQVSEKSMMVTGLQFGEAWIIFESDLLFDSVRIMVGNHILYIENIEELRAFRNAVNDGTSFKGVSAADGFDGDYIFFPGSLTWLLSSTIDNPWVPIGTSTHPFQGYFDAAEQAIGNLNITGTNDTVGFFGFIDNATISDLRLGGAMLNNEEMITSVNGSTAVGALVGCAKNSKIVSCVNGVKVQGVHQVGGLVGLSDGTIIENCVNIGVVITANGYGGGIAGATDSTIQYCINGGMLNSSEEGAYLGGICGKSNGLIINCLNTGVMGYPNTSHLHQAGICGDAENATLENCFNDQQMCCRPIVSDDSYTTIINSANKLTEEILGDLLQSDLGDARKWAFEAWNYPRLQTTKNIASGLIVGSPLVFSSSDQTIDNVSNFSVYIAQHPQGGANNPRWSSLSENIIFPADNMGEVTVNCMEEESFVKVTVKRTIQINHYFIKEMYLNIIKQYPKGTISGGASIYAGQTVELTLDFTGLPPYTYQITGDTTFYTTDSSHVVMAVSPMFTTDYRITHLSNDYCQARMSDITGNAFVRVTTGPEQIVADPVYYCQYDVAEPLAVYGVAGTVYWSETRDGEYSTVTPIPNTNIAGVFNYYVYQTNEVEGVLYYSDTTILSVIINAQPDTVITGKKGVVLGGSTTLHASTGTQYEWYQTDQPDVILSTTDSLTVSPTEPTGYSVNIYSTHPKTSPAAISEFAIGDIITSDNVLIKPERWADAFEYGYTASGIIYQIDSMAQKVHILSIEEGSGIPWGFYGMNIVELLNITNPILVVEDMSGKSNTDIMIAFNNNLETPLTATECAAVWARRLGEEWYLPAVGEMLNASREKDVINATIATMSSSYPRFLETGTTERQWTSTSYSSNLSWYIDQNNALRFSNRNSNQTIYKTRAVKRCEMQLIHTLDDSIVCSAVAHATVNICTDDYLEIVDTTCAGNVYTEHGFNIDIPITFYGPREEQLHLYNQLGCDSIISLSLYVLRNSELTVSGNTLICGGDSTILTAQGGNRYEWYSADDPTTLLSDSAQLLVSVDDATHFIVHSFYGNYPFATIGDVAIGDFITDDDVLIKQADYEQAMSEGKNIVGIVFDINSETNKVKIVSLTEATNIPWGFYGRVIPNVTLVADPTVAQNDMNGENYTNAIIAFNNLQPTPSLPSQAAAVWARSLGDAWYLPSSGEMYSIFNQKTELNNAINLLPTQPKLWPSGTYYWYWTSTAYSYTHAWCVRFSGLANNAGRSAAGANCKLRAVRNFDVNHLHLFNAEPVYCDNTLDVFVQIDEVFNLPDQIQICESETMEFPYENTGNITWWCLDTSIVQISSTGVVTGISEGTTLAGYATNNGCVDTVEITVLSIPKIVAEEGTELCLGGNLQLGYIREMEAVWISADPEIATVSDDGMVLGVSAGSVYIHFTAINGCDDSILIQVHPLPSGIITGPTSVCINHLTQSYSFTSDSPSTAYNYLWTVEGGLPTTGTEIPFTITWDADASEHNVSVAISSEHGCENSFEKSVTLVALPEIMVLSPAAQIVNDTLKVCQSDTLSLMVEPVGIGCQWNYPAGSASTQTILLENITLSESGWYYVTVTQETCTERDSVYVMVQESQGEPFIHCAIYYGAILDTIITEQTQIDTFVYAADLYAKLYNPVAGENVVGCGYELRYNFSAMGAVWTDWFYWDNPEVEWIIDRDFITPGFMKFQVRSAYDCASQFCGEVQVREYSFYVEAPETFLRGTADIDQMSICKAQNSVTIRDIYSNWFNSNFQRIETQTIYYDAMGGDVFYETEWTPLTDFGQQFYDSIVVDGITYPVLVEALPDISVWETPNGIPLNTGNVIVASGRIATIASIEGTDTTWGYSAVSNTSWGILPDPSISGLFDQYTCADNMVTFTAVPSYTSLSTYIDWQYAAYPSQDYNMMTSSNSPVTTEYFSYYNEGIPNNVTLQMYNFVNNPDTISIVASMSSIWLSCPEVYDTVMVYVYDDHQMSHLSGGIEQTICTGNPIEDIVYQLGGGAVGAAIEWTEENPTGIELVIGNNTAAITGTTTVTGTFPYIIETVGEHDNECNVIVANGSITVNPNATLTWNEFSGSEEQFVCPGIDIIPIEYYFNSHEDLSFEVSGLPEGIDYTFENDLITITGNTLISGIFEYTIITTGAIEPCTNDTVRGTVTIPDFQGTPLSFNVESFGTGCSIFDGSIVVKATGGAKPYVYSISDVAGEMYSITTNDTVFIFPNLISNRPYWVSVHDDNQCEVAPQNPILLTEPPTTNLSLFVLNYGSGCSDGDGSINVMASGGVPPYIYKLTTGATTFVSEPTYETNYTYTELAMGYFYMMSVEDANLCEVNAMNPVILPALPLLTLHLFVTEYGSGCTEGDGSIRVSVIGGVPPYIYMIDDGNHVFSATSDTTYVFENLIAGTTYTVSAKDANLCLKTAETPITLPLLAENVLDLEISNFGSGCTDGSGFITVTATGGIAPYIYRLNNGTIIESEPTYETSYTFSNLYLGNEYYVSVRDSAFCTLSLPDMIELPPLPEEPLQVSLVNYGGGCVNGEGTVIVKVSNGVAPYIYKLFNGTATVSSEPTNDTVYQFNNLYLNTTYTASVIDANTCETVAAEGSVVLTLSETPLTVIDVTWGTGCTYVGFIDISIAGGESPYTYLLYNNDTAILIDTTNDVSHTFNDLQLGTSYMVQVLDNNFCKVVSDEIAFVDRPDSLFIYVNNYGSGCTEGSGTIEVSAQGGLPPYIYRVYKGEALISESEPIEELLYNFENLTSATTYRLSVMDSYFCEIFTDEITLPPLSTTPLSLRVDNYGSGCSAGNGYINVTAAGGTMPYIYRIFDGTNTFSSNYSYSTTYIYDNLIVGTTYTVSILDVNLCEITAEPITIPQLSINSLNCVINKLGSGCYDGDGSIVVSTSGGEPPYIYKIFDGVNTILSQPTNQTVYVYENLNLGTSYYISVIDDNMCEKFPLGGSGLTLPALSATPLLLESLEVTDGCGSTPSTIEIHVSGGSGRYTYSLSDGTNSGVISDVSYTFTNVSEGTLLVKIEDSNLCDVSQEVEIHNYEKPFIVTTPSHYICYGTSTELSVLWGQSDDFDYEWSVSGEVIGTEPTITVMPEDTTTYTLLVSNRFTECDTLCNVVVAVGAAPRIILVQPENAEIENDTLHICDSYGLILSVEPTRSEYTWSYPTGSSLNQNITIPNFGPENIGWYVVTVNQSNCLAKDSIYITTQDIQGRPFATVNFYRGDVFQHTQLTPNGIDSIVYSYDLNVIISDPVDAPNVEGCGFEYRLFYTSNEGWTEWTEWTEYTDSVVISAVNLARIGYTTVQLRHELDCASQFCGDVLIHEYSFFVMSADTLLQATPLINEQEICKGQENVFMTNIYERSFRSEVARYEYQFGYHSPDEVSYYNSEWIPLSQVGQIFEDTMFFDDGMYALMVPSTPPISVMQTPDGQITDNRDLIHVAIRVAMVNYINEVTHDTTWAVIDSIFYSWALMENPSFEPFADNYICYSCNDHIVEYTVDYPERADQFAVSWYYADDPNGGFIELPMSENLVQTPLFTYWNAEAFPYNRSLFLFEFANPHDSIVIIAELSSPFASCPTFRDTSVIYVLESHYIDLMTANDTQRVCRQTPIENMVWQLSGGADSAYIEWRHEEESYIPSGVHFTIDGNNAIVSGTPDEAGTFDFVIYTLGNEAHGHFCDQKSVVGQIVVDPVFENDTVYDETCQSHELYTSSLYPRFTGIDVTQAGIMNIDSTFTTKNGCDSMVTLILTVHQGFAHDTIFETTCQSTESYTSPEYPTFHNIDVSQSGVYIFDTLSHTVFGCDSLKTLKLTVYSVPEHATVFDTTCKSSKPYISELYPDFGAIDVSRQGVMIIDTTFRTTEGCDSMVTLQLTVNVSFIPDTMYESTCQSDIPFTSVLNPIFHDIDVSTVGTFYLDSLFLTTDHCDSTVVLRLTVNPVYSSVVIDDYTCQSNEPYTSTVSPRFHGIDVSETGVVIIDSVFKTAKGCDSSVTLRLQVNPVYDFVFYDSICQGEIYTQHGFLIPATITGTSRYTRSLNTSLGCDSIITLWLNVLPAFNSPIIQYICEGESYVDDNFEIIQPYPGVYRDTAIFSTGLGCDSVIRLILIVQSLPVIESSVPLVNDTAFVCALEPLTLKAMPAGANSYEWSYHGVSGGGAFYGNHSNDQEISTFASGINLLNEGWYVVTVDRPGCSTKDSIYVKPLPHQTAPVATAKVYRGNEYIATITSFTEEDTIMYSSDMNIIISNPISGNYTTPDCPLEYRYYFAYDDEWTDWILWSDTSLPIYVPNEEIKVGYTRFEMRHIESCGLQSCGSPMTKLYAFVVAASPEMLQGKADINQFFICKEQDSVRVTDIYKIDFDNTTSIFQYSSEYRRGGSTYYLSEWEPLTQLGQILDTVYLGDTAYALKIPTTPLIPVSTTPNGDTTLPIDHIRINIRIITASINRNDTTWSVESQARFMWNIVENPHFITSLSDQYVCQKLCTNDNSIQLFLNLDENCYPEWVTWYYAQHPSQEYHQMTPPQGIVSNGLFSYRRADVSIQPYNNDIAMFDYVNESDTIHYLAELKSSLRSCPNSYEDFTVYVMSDHYIELYQGEQNAEACIDKPLDSIIYKFNGGAGSAVLTWLGTIPSGIIYQNQDGYGIFSGTPTILGSFSYRLISIPNNSLNNCKIDTLYGEITTHRNYAYNSSATICQGGVYNWRGQSLTESGIYYDSLENVFGCDSIYQLTLTVNPSYDSTINVEICEGTNYTDHGFNFIQSESGEFFDTLYYTSIKGCDSIVKLHLIVHPSTHTVFEEDICEGDNYIGNGFEVIHPQVGDTSLTRHFLSETGCDSIITLHLTVHPVYQTDITETRCHGESYNFFGEIITQSGNYSHLLSSVEGCDSIITLHLHFRPNVSVEVDASICEGGCYMLGSYSLCYEGFYQITLQTQNGCDSLVSLNLTVNDHYIIPIIADICEGESYHENGFEIMNPQTGVMYDSITLPGQICDSVVALTLTVLPTFETHVSDSICEGDVYNFHGTILTEPGTYETTLSTYTNAACDSTIVLSLKMNPFDVQNISGQIPLGGAYDFYGEVVTEPGNYTHYFENNYGCDSIIILNLTVGDEYLISIDTTICEEEIYIFGDSVITTSGVYTHTFIASIGCDSIVTLSLTVASSYFSETEEVLCSNDPYEWRGHHYSSSGIYWDSLQTVNGCDSIFKLTLTLSPIYFFPEESTVCSNEPYIWRHQTLTESGVYWDSLQTVNGCDSIYQITLQLYPYYFFEEVQTVCSNDAVEWHGQTLTESGVYFDEWQTSEGCDSINQLVLNLYPLYEYSEEATICGNDTLEWHSQTLTESGVYWDSVQTVSGCDSIYQLTLQVNPYYFFEEIETLCGNDTVEWHGQVLTESGVYLDEQQAADGCDSIYQLTLNLRPLYDVNEEVSICSNDAYEWHGVVYTESGYYTDSLQSIWGCDSICHLDLQLNPVYHFTEEAWMCNNGSYIWHGQTLTVSGTYWDSLTATSGCDSIYQLNLELYPEYHFSDFDTICEGDSVLFGGVYLSEAGVYADTLQTIDGCDSIITLNLMIDLLPTVIQISGPASVCQGSLNVFSATIENADACFWTIPEEFTIVQGQGTNMISILAPDTELVSEISVYGENECGDGASVSYPVTVNSSYEVQMDAYTCEGEPYNYHGQILIAPGEYIFTHQTASGCDSVVHLFLNVHQNHHVIIHDEVCQDEMYYGYGFSIYASGSGLLTRNRQLVSQYGCDSMVTLNLTIHPKYNQVISKILCKGDSIEFNGNYLTQEGNYQVAFESSQGCDSTVLLKVLLVPIFNVEQEQTICEGENYVFGDEILTESGIYTKTLVSQFWSCDSTVTLTLNVAPLYDTSFSDMICEGGVYDFNGEMIDEPGIYTQTLSSTYSCDSVVTVTLSMAQPLIPENVMATNESEYILITWDGVGDAFEIYRDGKYIETVTENTYSDLAVTHNVKYCYAIRTLIAECESEMSAESCNVFRDADLLFGIYPNPAKDEISVMGENMVKVTIYSITQTMTEVIPSNPSRIDIDLSRFETGTYFMRIYTSQGEEIVKRFIILR